MIKDEYVLWRYLGVPYVHKGRSIQGLDCYGLIIRIYEDLGIKLFDIEEDYAPDWSWKNKNYFLENAHNDWMEVDKPKLFDVVLFKNGKGIINHAGVMFDENRFMNTCRAGTVVCKLSDSIWLKRLVGYYRYKGLNDNN